ncbi:zinc-dependent alcohol dehydrogenase [Gordonia aichiensis]|uniref:zinc-dependent alcohol dehydrogenase n=1 Tax=Gordonia aichiensis TaxID=36820 RepID=UPI003265AA90
MTMLETAHDCGYPIGRRHRPRSTVGHLLGALCSSTAIPAASILLDRSSRERLDRFKAAAAQRRRRGPRMRALSVGPGGRIEWCDAPVPLAPGPRGATVHPIAAATCDLDRAMALGRTPFLLPFHFGHECVAEVVEVGDDVTTVRPGDRVVVPFQISCGTCARCVAGLTSNCLSVPPISMYGFGLMGGHWGGAYSELLGVPFADGMLVPLPEGIDPVAAASVADNVTDAYRTVAPYIDDLLGFDRAADVVILAEVGRRIPLSSSVPLYAGQIAKALGVENVHLVDRRPHVRRHAEALGIEAHSPDAMKRVPRAGLVIDDTGSPAGLGLAIKQTAPDGTCVSGVSLVRSTALPTALMYGRNITFRLGRSNARANIPAVLELMRTGALKPELVTTHRGEMRHADRAVDEHVRGEATKTIVVED